jgi:hypothetical protein
MTPDKVPSPLPTQCALDRDVLTRIDTNVTELTDKFHKLIEVDGPIASIKERMSLVEAAVLSAHDKVNDAVDDIDVLRGQANGLAIKVGTIAALFSSGLMGVIFHFLGEG